MDLEEFNDRLTDGVLHYGPVVLACMVCVCIVGLLWTLFMRTPQRTIHWDAEGCYVTRTVGVVGKGGHVEKLYLDAAVCNAVSER